MNTQAKKKLLPAHPKGEGKPVSITDLKARDEGGFNFNVSLGEAASPQRVFSADSFDFAPNDAGVRLVFISTRIYGGGARAIVDISLSRQAAINVANTANEHWKAMEGAVLYKLEAEPENALSLTANFARVHVADLATTVDFYYATGMALDAAPSLGEVVISDVVRVQTNKEVMYAVFRELEAYRDAVKSL